MNNEDATHYVVQELGKHRRRSDIVTEICEQTGLDWDQAQKFVYQVAYEQRKSIAARQSPLVIVFGIAFIAGGLLLAIGAALAGLAGISFAIYGVPFLGNLLGVGFGLVVIAGGVIGLWQRIRTFFE